MPNQIAKGKKTYLITVNEENVRKFRERQKSRGESESLSFYMDMYLEKVLKENGELISNCVVKCRSNKEEAA